MRIRTFRRALLGKLFHSLYRFGHWVYDPVTAICFGTAWHNWRRVILPWIGAGPVLEIGCGTGQLLPELSQRSQHVVGMDLSASMLGPARARAGIDHVSLVRASAYDLPFSTGTFESVVCAFPAGFVMHREVLNEIARVLMPGGRFLVVASARFTRFQWTRPFIHPLLRFAYGSAHSMNRWPEASLNHSLMPGDWQDLRTPEGEAFVWVAERKANVALPG